LPILDVDHYCGAVSTAAGVNPCIERQQDAYDQLKEEWGELSPSNQRLVAQFHDYDSMLTVAGELLGSQEAQEEEAPQPPKHFQP